MTVGLTARSSQAGLSLVKLLAAAVILALLALLIAPLLSHGTALVVNVEKSKIQTAERTRVVVVGARENPPWSYVARPVPGGTVTLEFTKGLQILPGAQTKATATTNHQGAAFFIVVGARPGEWSGTVTFRAGSESESDEVKIKIEVTGDIFGGTYVDDSSLDFDDA